MPNTALNRTVAALLTNQSGGAVTYGAVVIQDTANASSFTTTTTAGLSTRQVGVVIEPNGIANGAVGMVAFGGYVPRVNLDGAATIGQFIETDTVAGQGTPHSSPQGEGDFGVALTASANPEAILFGSPNGPGSAGSGITELTGDVTAGPGSGAQAATIVNFDLNTVNGRLTLTTATPITTADVTAASTIYFTPYKGNKIALYTGSTWLLMSFTELSLALSALTSGRPYDVFIDYNGGTPQITITAWTNDTTRATALTLQDGVLVQTGNLDWRYVGTIYTTSTTTTEDSMANRYVWNYYNRVKRFMKGATETANSWTYSTASYRQANANAANQLSYVCGVQEDIIEAQVGAIANGNASNQAAAVGIGVDSTTVTSSLYMGSNLSTFATQLRCLYEGFPGIGKHNLVWLEQGHGSGTQTWYGDAGGPTIFQSGIFGNLWA